MAKIIEIPFLRQTKVFLFSKSTKQICRNHTTNAPVTTSISQKEMKNFEKLGSDWWNKNGPLKALHSLNSIR